MDRGKTNKNMADYLEELIANYDSRKKPMFGAPVYFVNDNMWTGVKGSKILDEPSLGLAPIIVADVFKLLTEIRKMGVTILLVEQMVDNALSISDYAYVLETGNIVFSGTRDEVKNSDDMVKAYLGNV